MRSFLTTLFISFLFLNLSLGQRNYVYDDVMEVQSEQGIREFVSIDLVHKAALKTNEKRQVVETLIDFDRLSFKKIISNKADYVELQVENLNGESVPLLLIRADIHTPGFSVVVDAADGRFNYPVDLNESVFYRGIVQDEANSLVALSFHDEIITGFINSDNYGNIGLQLNGDGQNVMVDLSSLSHEDLTCGTIDDGMGYAPEMLKAPRREKAAGDYVAIFIEVENDLTDWQGGVSQALAYITDIFNQSAAIYAGDGVDTRISVIDINTTQEYGIRRGRNTIKPNSSSSYLSLFQDAQSSTFDGDLAQLVVFNNVGGVAAGFSGLCNSDRRQSMCMSGFVTDYWFNVQIFAHELGHLFGSRHTHACVWNGNNTAIDGCSGSTEGTCPLPPPAGQNEGTIMSYCYNNYGLDFNEGFHPQPAAVLQNNVIAATCLNSGSGGGSCFDGVQNGDETGVDCGGSCVACPTCTDGVQNGDETGVDCGGSCPTTCPPFSCDDPTDLAVLNMKNKRGTGTAILDWTDVSGANSYDMRIRVSGTTSWTDFNTTVSDISLEGFAGNTDYEWEVRANCTGGSSNYSGCTFTYVTRGDDVVCGTVSPGSSYTPFNETDQINVSPNPVSDFLLIQWNVVGAEGRTVEIINALGQTVYDAQMKVTDTWLEVDVQNFETGVYFVSVTSMGSRTVKTIMVE